MYFQTNGGNVFRHADYNSAYLLKFKKMSSTSTVELKYSPACARQKNHFLLTIIQCPPALTERSGKVSSVHIPMKTKLAKFVSVLEMPCAEIFHRYLKTFIDRLITVGFEQSKSRFCGAIPEPYRFINIVELPFAHAVAESQILRTDFHEINFYRLLRNRNLLD